MRVEATRLAEGPSTRTFGLRRWPPAVIVWCSPTDYGVKIESFAIVVNAVSELAEVSG